MRFRFGRWSQLFDSDSSSDDGDDGNSAGGAKLHAPQRRSDAPEGADGTHLAQPQAQGQEQAHGAQRAGDGEAGRQEPSCDGQTGSLRCPFPLTARVTCTSCSEVALSIPQAHWRHPYPPAPIHPSHRGFSPSALSRTGVDACSLQGLQPQPRWCTRRTGSVRTAQRAMGVAHSRRKRSGSGATTARSSLPYSGAERPSRHGTISFAAVPPSTPAALLPRFSPELHRVSVRRACTRPHTSVRPLASPTVPSPCIWAFGAVVCRRAAE